MPACLPAYLHASLSDQLASQPVTDHVSLFCSLFRPEFTEISRLDSFPGPVLSPGHEFETSDRQPRLELVDAESYGYATHGFNTRTFATTESVLLDGTLLAMESFPGKQRELNARGWYLVPSRNLSPAGPVLGERILRAGNEFRFRVARRASARF